ncbi:MAG TPA: MarR family transcriptional regulator [Ilumatobacteraceae bacterium]
MPTLQNTSPPHAAASSADLAAALRHTITRLARRLRQQDQTGLGPTMTAALASVRNLDGPTHGELAAVEQVSPPTITAVVGKLEGLGLVAREPDPADRRVMRIRITPAGTEQLDAVRSRRTEWLESQLRALSADELNRLHAAADVLVKLTETLDESAA